MNPRTPSPESGWTRSTLLAHTAEAANRAGQPLDRAVDLVGDALARLDTQRVNRTVRDGPQSDSGGT